MSIVITDRLFTLNTVNSVYQFAVDAYGILRYLYHETQGRRRRALPRARCDCGFPGNLADTGDDRTLPVDTLHWNVH